MGKKGSWFSAIKKVFTSNSKDKPVNEAEKKSWKEKKGGRGRLKHGSFMPFSREPSSIEKILGEVDQHNLFIQQSEPPQPSISGGRPSPPRVTSPPTSPPRITSVSPKQTEISHKPQPTLQQHHLSATKIQAAYRGYMARRNIRGLTGLARLQGVISGQNVKRQTVNAMKRMQLLVRVQTQIQSRRMQMLENQALKRQSNKNLDTSLASNLSEMGDENWDDSLVTKEEREARLQKKAEALIKRERAMSYASSHQLRKATPKSTKNSLMDARSGGYPWWWNWLDRQLPSDTTKPSNPDHKRLDTPMSSRSMAPSRTRQQMTPSRTPPMKYSINKARRGSPYPMKDDDSLMSCPAFSVPNYMSPTVSARSKARPTTSNPKDRAPSTPGSETSNRRFSFPLTPNSNNGSFKWNKGNKKHKSPGSIGDMSVDSAVSVPATVGRKPFNRFV